MISHSYRWRAIWRGYMRWWWSIMWSSMWGSDLWQLRWVMSGRPWTTGCQGHDAPAPARPNLHHHLTTHTLPSPRFKSWPSPESRVMEEILKAWIENLILSRNNNLYGGVRQRRAVMPTLCYSFHLLTSGIEKAGEWLIAWTSYSYTRMGQKTVLSRGVIRAGSCTVRITPYDLRAHSVTHGRSCFLSPDEYTTHTCFFVAI